MMEGDILTAVQALQDPCFAQDVEPEAFGVCLHAMTSKWQQSQPFCMVYMGCGKLRLAMIPTAHAWTLSTTQAMHLADACATYRAYAQGSVPSSPERIQAMKAVQAVQGRLLEAQVARGNEMI